MRSTTLSAIMQANSQDFRNFIKHCENRIQNFTTQQDRHKEHVVKLHNQFYEVTTKEEQEAILREIARTQRDIDLFHQMINFDKNEIQRKINEVT